MPEIDRQARAAYDRSMTDVHAQYRLVADGFDAVVGAVPPDMWDAQSPCEGWRARDVMAHVIDGHRGVVARVRGGTPVPLGDGEDPVGPWRAAARDLSEVTGDPEVLAMAIDGPAGKMPAGEVIGKFVVMDLLVHTWDLARTVGADERLDEGAVRDAYEILLPMDERIRQPQIFGPKLDPPPGADLQTELLYFVGRRA